MKYCLKSDAINLPRNWWYRISRTEYWDRHRNRIFSQILYLTKITLSCLGLALNNSILIYDNSFIHYKVSEMYDLREISPGESDFIFAASFHEVLLNDDVCILFNLFIEKIQWPDILNFSIRLILFYIIIMIIISFVSNKLLYIHVYLTKFTHSLCFNSMDLYVYII